MSDHYKYPRTPHLPFSPGATSDDKWASQSTLDRLASGIEIVTTEKMDGGGLSFYHDGFHGRSLDSGTHAWDHVAKGIWASIQMDIPEGWKISGESMYARRSVAYENLPSAFIIFGIWNEKKEALAWDDVVLWSELWGLPTVPLLYRGTDFQNATHIWFESHDSNTSEGFVVRNAGSFAYADFDQNIAKYVRANHVRTSADWRHRDDFELNTFITE